MTVQNRISISLNDFEFSAIERLATHMSKSKAEIIRLIIEEFIRDNPNRFRLKSNITRSRNIVLDD
jgi:predicted DNA-binding protein